jgi:hypothetical protein
VSSNRAQMKCIRYNIMWYSLSVTCCWTVVDVKHQSPSPIACDHVCWWKISFHNGASDIVQIELTASQVGRIYDNTVTTRSYLFLHLRIPARFAGWYHKRLVPLETIVSPINYENLYLFFKVWFMVFNATFNNISVFVCFFSFTRNKTIKHNTVSSPQLLI